MATTVAENTTDAAEEAAASTLQKLREQTDAVVQRVRPQVDAVADYARNEPTKALLIAAATGAALMGIVALLSRPSSRTEQARSSAMSTMATIRNAAIDLADRAHTAATDALAASQAAKKSALKTAEKARKSAEKAQSDVQSTADSVSDTVTDAWQSLRDQAAPVVDRFKPQIDAVTSYAKEEPARTALGVAAAGAVLVGLLAMIRGSERD